MLVYRISSILCSCCFFAFWGYDPPEPGSSGASSLPEKRGWKAPRGPVTACSIQEYPLCVDDKEIDDKENETVPGAEAEGWFPIQDLLAMWRVFAGYIPVEQSRVVQDAISKTSKNLLDVKKAEDAMVQAINVIQEKKYSVPAIRASHETQQYRKTILGYVKCIENLVKNYHERGEKDSEIDLQELASCIEDLFLQSFHIYLAQHLWSVFERKELQQSFDQIQKDLASISVILSTPKSDEPQGALGQKLVQQGVENPLPVLCDADLSDDVEGFIKMVRYNGRVDVSDEKIEELFRHFWPYAEKKMKIMDQANAPDLVDFASFESRNNNGTRKNNNAFNMICSASAHTVGSKESHTCSKCHTGNDSVAYVVLVSDYEKKYLTPALSTEKQEKAAKDIKKHVRQFLSQGENAANRKKLLSREIKYFKWSLSSQDYWEHDVDNWYALQACVLLFEQLPEA